jgi:protein-S-isoprenylcysteine O-methyltransferase Ste14
MSLIYIREIMKKENLYFVLLWAAFGVFRIAIHFRKHGTIKAETKDNVLFTMILPYMFSILAAFWEFELRTISINLFASSIGLLLFTSGSIIQLSALYTLDRQFSNALELQSSHILINTGIYKIVRHPIYLGIILQGLSSIFLLNVISPLFFMLLSTTGVLLRIKKEEVFLIQSLPGYQEYTKRTYALIPGIY